MIEKFTKRRMEENKGETMLDFTARLNRNLLWENGCFVTSGALRRNLSAFLRHVIVVFVFLDKSIIKCSIFQPCILRIPKKCSKTWDSPRKTNVCYFLGEFPDLYSNAFRRVLTGWDRVNFNSVHCVMLFGRAALRLTVSEHDYWRNLLTSKDKNPKNTNDGSFANNAGYGRYCLLSVWGKKGEKKTLTNTVMWNLIKW